MNVQFSEQRLARAKELITHYPEGRQKSALIPILHLAQEENGGWISVAWMDYVAELLGWPRWRSTRWPPFIPC